jgi:hypothetical protein
MCPHSRHSNRGACWSACCQSCGFCRSLPDLACPIGKERDWVQADVASRKGGWSMSESPAPKSTPGGGELLSAPSKVFQREIQGTRRARGRDRGEDLDDRSSGRPISGVLTFVPIGNVAIGARLGLPPVTANYVHACSEVLTDETSGPDGGPGLFTSANARRIPRPEVLAQEMDAALQYPDIFTRENVSPRSQKVRYRLPGVPISDGPRIQIPTGRKFNRKIFIKFPTGRNLLQNSLDISNVVIIRCTYNE